MYLMYQAKHNVPKCNTAPKCIKLYRHVSKWKRVSITNPYCRRTYNIEVWVFLHLIFLKLFGLLATRLAGIMISGAMWNMTKYFFEKNDSLGIYYRYYIIHHEVWNCKQKYKKFYNFQFIPSLILGWCFQDSNPKEDSVLVYH